jgi:cytochrome b subunit of formate dehydrogenase
LAGGAGMTLDSDNLRKALREKQRRELAAKVTKAKDSSTSRRVVYWLAILLAAVLIVAGMVLMVASAMQLRLW